MFVDLVPRTRINLNFIGALGAERRGGMNELVGEQEFGRGDVGEIDQPLALGGGDADRLAVNAFDDP